MIEIERHQHMVHAMLPSFSRKVDWTKHIIEDALAHMEYPYIAFSGGIDSTVLLDMLYQAGHRVDVLWGDDGWDYPESLTFLRETEARYGFTLRRIRCLEPWHDWCMEMDQPDLAADPDLGWRNPREWADTWPSLKHAVQHGYDGVFLGMLASESRSRMHALRGGQRSLYETKSEGGMRHCSPLAAWTKRDVWAYAVNHDLAYNLVYEKLAGLGLPLERRRVAPLTCFRTTQYGSVVAIKAGWPDLFNELAALFPKVRMYS